MSYGTDDFKIAEIAFVCHQVWTAGRPEMHTYLIHLFLKKMYA